MKDAAMVVVGKGIEVRVAFQQSPVSVGAAEITGCAAAQKPNSCAYVVGQVLNR